MHGLRREYTGAAIDENRLDADPVKQFNAWFEDAAELPEPNAMTLATVDAGGQPDARTLLLKSCDARGFTFFTNYRSAKAGQLADAPRAAMLFFWGPLHRQVRIRGRVERTTRAESEEYFATRPRESQLGAWASPQSEEIASRDILEQRLAQAEARFAGRPVDCPDHWGGYRLVPESIEFWQGRPARLHDRIEYRRGEDGHWARRRLAP